MKRFLMITAAALAAVCCGGDLIRIEDLSLDERGRICPFRQFQPFFELDLGKDPAIWNRDITRNYRNLVNINIRGTMFGQKCLLVTRSSTDKEKDTAWSVGTKPFPYTGKPGSVVICVEAAGDVEKMGNPHPDGYRNDIEWLDARGKPLGVTQLKYDGDARRFIVTRCTGTVPAGTKSFILRFGFDSPNIGIGSFCAVRSLKIAAADADVPYVKKYSFETAPFEISGKTLISWKADTPAGTGITVAASAVRFENGVPVGWSPLGPEQSRPFAVTAPWVRFRITFRTAGTACPVLKEFSVGERKETVWIHRQFTVLPLVENRTVSPARDPKTDVVLRIFSDSPVDWKSLKVSVDGTDVSGKLNRNGYTVTYRTDKPYAPGKHTVKVTAAGMTGSAEFTKYFLIGNGPAVPKITLRDDGMTLVDGKPFFPIGFYSVWKREFNNYDFDKCMKDLKEAGINFVHTYNNIDSPDGEQLLAAGRKYGMKFWVWMRNPDSRSFRKHVNNPDILAWYIGDDTSAHTTPAALQDLNDHLHALDDKRITAQADGGGKPWAFVPCRYFVPGADNFLFELYPVRENTDSDRDSCAAKVIQDIRMYQYDVSRSRTDRPRSLWSIIQYFQGWGHWKRFPEENEIRAMSFASIIHGATGITWYTYGGYHHPKNKRTDYGVTSSPERWRIITNITKQLNQLIPVLTERSPKDQPQVTVLSGPAEDVYGNPSVACLLKRHDGKSYLLTVNAVRRNVKASFRLPGLRGGKVLFENRTCEVKNGLLTDDFKPYDVHIYELQ